MPISLCWGSDRHSGSCWWPIRTQIGPFGVKYMVRSVPVDRQWGCMTSVWSVIALLSLLGPTLCRGDEQGQRCDARVSFQRVDSLLKLKQYGEARALLGRLEACHNLAAIDMFNIGWLYGKARDFPSALTIFRSVNADVPDHLTHEYAIALSEFELGDYKAAVKVLSVLRSKGLCTARCSDLLGVAYSKLGLYQDAYPVLAENFQKNPRDPFSYLNLVTFFADTGDFAKAAEIASRAVAAFPRNTEPLMMRGSVNMYQGRLESAHDDFAAAVRLSPRDPDAYFFVALSDYKEDRFADAASELRSAIGSGIVDSDLHYLLAECAIRLDPTKPLGALLELNRAIEIDTKSVSARTLRGKLLLQGGYPREAVADLRLAHKMAPDSRSALYNLARAYSALGKAEEAKSLFAQLSAKTPDVLGELSDRRLKTALNQ
jgi:tetratricopeptide (TPR) repeat protein